MDYNNIVEVIAKRLNLHLPQVAAVLKLTDDGCTIPFISRYRKEATSNLDELAIKAIIDLRTELEAIEKRREFIYKTLSDSDVITPELSDRLNKCNSLIELEDFYLPYKPKKRTKAEIARQRGLEPLAKMIMAQNNPNIRIFAEKFINKEVADVDSGISGALDIIAEWISENEKSRNIIRGIYSREAILISKVVRGKEQAGDKYQNYFDFSKPLKYIGSHQLLAVRRGESEGLLKVSIAVDTEKAIDKLKNLFIKRGSATADLIEIAIKDSYKRLLQPSIENEFAVQSKKTADDVAINTFSQNLRQLLMSAPLIGKRILAIDPGYRTGCKVVCLDENGKLLHNDVIYPNQPHNKVSESIRKISYLVEAYEIDAISLGNGTASRETEKMLTNISYPRIVQVYVVNESGASIYSASSLAREEFPDKDVTVRGAVSIGRRLLDPLAELVKIDPRSVGVGQYQYDVDQAKLKNSLDFVVESCVNSAGVNVNTASKELLSYVSGIGPSLATNIIQYRNDNGSFSSRDQLKDVARMGPKAFEQSAGFLRIPGAKNPLDNSAVHPESYYIVERIANKLNVSIEKLIGNKGVISQTNIADYKEVGEATLKDILNELEKPGRDPRQKVKIVEFDNTVKSIEDLKEGMILNGIVTNITDFGAFVDMGIKENGLLHISEISDTHIKHPSDILKLNQGIKVKIIGVDTVRKRISLSLKGV